MTCHVKLRPQSSATCTGNYATGGPGVAGGGFPVGRGGGQLGLSMERRPDLDRMREFREHMQIQNLGPSSNTTSARNINNIENPVPAARSLEHALSQSTAPAAARGTEAAPAAGVGRVGGEGERARVTLLRLTNPDNEVNFTTGDIKSVIVNIAIQEGLSTEFITPQLLQGGRGPFNVTVSEDLGKFLVEEEEIELLHCGEGEEAIMRSIFTVKRLDAQGRVVDDDTEKKIKDARAARRIENNMVEREHTYRFFIDGNPEMLLMKAQDPARHQLIFREAVNSILAHMTMSMVERFNYTVQIDSTGQELNQVILFIVRSKHVTELEFLRGVQWSEIKYIHVQLDMNPIKVRIMREVAETVGVKPCCFLPECSATGPFACGARARAMERVKLPSNFKSDYDQERKLSKRAREEERGANKQRLMEAVQRATSAKSTHMCKKYTKGQCRRHMFDTYQRPADSSCRFTHGDREQTGKVACYHKSACSYMGCPYLHPPERQAMAVDVNGDLMASNA